MSQAKIARGKKWHKVREENKFRGNQVELDWMETQPSITDSIKAYEDSLEKPKPKEEPKKKVK